METKSTLDVKRNRSRSKSRDSGGGSRPNSKQSTQGGSSRRRSSQRRKSTGGKRSSQSGDEFDDGNFADLFGGEGFRDIEVQIKAFLYSEEVDLALSRLRERRTKRNKFKKSEVHIFHLPKIMTGGALPVQPSASLVRSVADCSLPEPKELPKLPMLRPRRQRTLLIDQTLENVEEELVAGSRRRLTPLSRSITNITKTPRITPRNTPRSTPRKSQGMTPRETPRATPR